MNNVLIFLIIMFSAAWGFLGTFALRLDFLLLAIFIGLIAVALSFVKMGGKEGGSK